MFILKHAGRTRDIWNKDPRGCLGGSRNHQNATGWVWHGVDTAWKSHEIPIDCANNRTDQGANRSITRGPCQGATDNIGLLERNAPGKRTQRSALRLSDYLFHCQNHGKTNQIPPSCWLPTAAYYNMPKWMIIPLWLVVIQCYPFYPVGLPPAYPCVDGRINLGLSVIKRKNGWFNPYCTFWWSKTIQIFILAVKSC